MIALLDTSVLVAGMVAGHKEHEASRTVLANKKTSFIISGHSVLELYAVLTRLPLSPRISPANAQKLIQRNLPSEIRRIQLSAREIESLVSQCAKENFCGGIVYDARIAQAARKGGAQRILTLNPKHFRRVAADLEVVAP